MVKSNSLKCRLIVFLALLCVSHLLLAQSVVENVMASRDNADSVIVEWDAVLEASSYEVTVEAYDVAINKTLRKINVDKNCFVDSLLPQPGLGRYTVRAVYGDGTKSEPSVAAIGYAKLDVMKLLGVSTRWPWNGMVDIDVEYKTMRPRFRELFGIENLPYPKSVTIDVKTVDGTSIPVKSITKEPAVDKNYTVNRRVVENGTEIFSGSGWQRFVWNADVDAPNIIAHGATVFLTTSDDYFKTKDSLTIDLDTTNPDFIELGENEISVPLPWVARWADEESRSLNMQDGTDMVITEISDYGEKELMKEEQLVDEKGIFFWQPSAYGVLYIEAEFKNRATAAESTLKRRFLRSPKIPIMIEPVSEQKALDIKWTAKGNCTWYQIKRRIVNCDGTHGEWQNLASIEAVTEGYYRDLDVACGISYEYSVCPMYPVNNNTSYLTASPSVWTLGRLAVGIALEVQSADKSGVVLSWTDVPDAYSYDVLRSDGGGQYKPCGNVAASDGTTFTDTNLKPGVRYKYKIVALDWKGNTLETTAPVDAYTQLDVLSLNGIQPRFPWAGLIDIIVSYKSARDAKVDGVPLFKLAAVSGTETLEVKTLMRADGTSLDPNGFTLSDDGMEQRLLWDARTDIGENIYPDGLTVTISCICVEPDNGSASATAFSDDAVYCKTESLDFHTVPEIVLGKPVRIYVDMKWFAGATQLETFVNDKSVATIKDDKSLSFTIGKEQLDVWGVNVLRLKTDNGMEWVAYMKYPDFDFTATQGEKKGVMVKWNSIEDIQTYSVRRRAANTDDAFVEVCLAENTTQWMDISEETVVGEFEYTVMPMAGGEDGGPLLTSVIGYRAYDILRPVIVMPTDNGRVMADKAEARYGEQIVLTVTPDSGYVLDRLSVMGGGTEVEVVPTGEGKFSFIMPVDNIVVYVSFESTSGVNGIAIEGKATGKMLRDGKILILRSGKVYTTTGIEMK